MKRTTVILSLIVIAAFFSSCSSGGKTGKVLAKINGDEVTESDLEFLGNINPRIQAQLITPTGKKKILENIVEQELLYQEAVKQGVNRDKDVQAKYDLYRKVIVAQALVEKEIENSAKEYYDENQDEFKKFKLSHIMIEYTNPEELKTGKGKKEVRSEEAALKLANDVKEKLNSGKDFAELAKEFSDDSATKNRGGDLGLVSKNDQRLNSRGFGPLIEKALELKVGENFGPIKTNKGYHIITVTRGLELEPFEMSVNAIMYKIKDSAKDELVKRLTADAKVVYTEEEEKTAKAEEKPAAEEAVKEEKANPVVEKAVEPAKPEEKKE